MSIDINRIRLPKKINPCPIIEAVVELRFDSSFPHDAIFGIIYNAFREDYPKVEELPILQLPETVRKQEPNLRYKPYYKLSKEGKFLFSVGARVISLVSLNPYCGWEVFHERIKDILGRIAKLEIIGSYLRIGIRYINGFDFDIFPKVNLSLNMNNDALIGLDSSVRIKIPSSQFLNTLRITNDAQVKKIDTTTRGSIIDIDTFIDNPKENALDLIEKGHLEEKKLFFTLLKKDFLEKELNPEY